MNNKVKNTVTGLIEVLSIAFIAAWITLNYGTPAGTIFLLTILATTVIRFYYIRQIKKVIGGNK